MMRIFEIQKGAVARPEISFKLTRLKLEFFLRYVKDDSGSFVIILKGTIF